MWMQSPFITNQVYRLCFMFAEVKTVALLCFALPTETAEASVVPSHHQPCQHKPTLLRGFCSLSVWSELRKTHVFQFRVGLAHSLSIFGVNCPETFCFKDVGTLMDTTGEAAGSFIKVVATRQTSHSQNPRGARHETCCLFAFPYQLSGKADLNITQDANIHMLCAKVTRQTHTQSTLPRLVGKSNYWGVWTSLVRSLFCLWEKLLCIYK